MTDHHPVHRNSIHRRITSTLKLILAVSLVLALWGQQWLNALAVAAILGVTFLPVILGNRFKVHIPSEFEALAVIFIVASLFLGEVHAYYTRFWWWDAVLHTMSGFLLGILGFLLVYVLNEKDNIEFHMKPGFVALFAFMFALGIGALWEIFEFTMDSLFGMNMQKSGLQDTMWDLIVDAIGAGTIAILGYGWLKRKNTESFLERWIQHFIETNPQMFRRQRKSSRSRSR
ncbi:uncharacterized membrane protein YjjP (DUF1212 family) [Methylohalomonas lacus]|uniref:Uncharacterized membrane protein YjjP (DUF1212 family) n=1 Tax=Methylohalomonas lacus TaxID=398773 RepID=A0AAE3L2G4_9GAMM|nr:hypothetical protein [Methylohalomonas lacus]MCS3904526.1 uncharacterized membrane protein YjjP (DUF1212 family) [Methylohalomonas lacus]